MDRGVVRYYRTADDYRRYTVTDRQRRAAIDRLYRRHRREFGRSVLDLACGGGVLGAVLERSGRRYLGVDVSPDMIRAARKAAKVEGSAREFRRGNIARLSVPGRFDTVTLLGNALGHVRIAEMEGLLDHLARNVHRGSTFLLDYRDVVGMLWDGSWARRGFTQQHKRGKVVFRSRSADLGKGVIHIRGRPATRGAWIADFTHAMWSPYILAALMRAHGWTLARRSSPRIPRTGQPEANYWEDVYRYDGRSRIPRPA